MPLYFHTISTFASDAALMKTIKQMPIIVPVIIIFSMLYAGSDLYNIIRILFIIPTAAFASVLCGAAASFPDEGYPLLAHKYLSVQVIHECSGYSFWTIMVSLQLWLLFSSRRLRQILWMIPLILAASYVLTIIANGLRICAVIYTTGIFRALFPASLHPGLHALTGILVFLPILCGSYYIIKKRLSHENEHSR
jgi:exosortase K